MQGYFDVKASENFSSVARPQSHFCSRFSADLLPLTFVHRCETALPSSPVRAAAPAPLSTLDFSIMRSETISSHCVVVCKGCSHPKCRATAGPCPGKDVHKGQNKDRQPRTTLSSWVLPVCLCLMSLLASIGPYSFPQSCVSLRSSVSAPNAHSQRAEDESSGQSSQSHPPQPVNPNHSSPHLPPPEPAHQHSTATLTPAPSKPAPAVEPVKHQARAMFDFPPENSRELELKKGDLVEVLKVDEEWWFGVLANGNEGTTHARSTQRHRLT